VWFPEDGDSYLKKRTDGFTEARSQKCEKWLLGA
jgi:hypothetical protein